VEVIPLPTIKAYDGRKGIAPLILNLAPDGDEWSTSCPCHFIPEKEPRYPRSTKMGGPQSQSGCFKKRE